MVVSVVVLIAAVIIATVVAFVSMKMGAFIVIAFNVTPWALCHVNI